METIKEQSENRVRRIEQKNSVNIIYLHNPSIIQINKMKKQRLTPLESTLIFLSNPFAAIILFIVNRLTNNR